MPTLGTSAQHIQNIYSEGKLDKEATSKSALLVQLEGNRRVRRAIIQYNLDMILTIGFRVSGARAVQFNRWAVETLGSYIVNGYAVNERRLAEDPRAQRELARVLRRVLTSEMEMYAKVREVALPNK
ncbi:MAG: virulence RhuM family protein [Candidatus Liptonbacteria bacterium]|nr:virulence RhuM family protein [Candidatus Liptonbacteria bacterium]